MKHYHFERLSAQDADFLHWESHALPMHGSGVMIFETGDLATPEGGVDFPAIKKAMTSVLHLVPRYRQKLLWPAGDSRPLWVDDARFNIDYHMRHIALPRPGAESQLKRLAADIMERPLDRGRPLWEMWVIEGLPDDRFALIAKIHHSVVDGASGMSILQHVCSISPEHEIREAPRFVPRPVPTQAELRRDVARRRLELPGRLLSELRDFAAGTGSLGRNVAVGLRNVRDMAAWKISPASDTPINGTIGPHRIFDWLELPLDAFKAVRSARSCSINDVVLTTVTGAVRELMIARQLQPEELDFRVSAPVNSRSSEDPNQPGNHVSSWILRLPLAEPDPLEQLRLISDTTRGLKESNQAGVIDLVMALKEWLPIDLQSAQKGTQNMLVTNVPGPPFPLYMLGAQLKSLFVQAPLLENVGLAVSALSYNGNIGWGFIADYDRLPDLGDFVKSVVRSFERLSDAAGTLR